jgi:hypothetical protein
MGHPRKGAGTMRSLGTVAILLLASMAVYAQAAKPCEDLKAEIAKKMDANGVKAYTLEIVSTEKAKDSEGKVVGSCAGGTNKIVYRRTTTSSATPAAAASKTAEPK